MGRAFAVKAVHKQMFPATYNFRGDDNGDEPDGWTTNNSADCTTTVIASKDGHKKVLQLYANNGAGIAQIYRSITQTLDGTVELCWGKDDITNNAAVILSLFEGATLVIYVYMSANDLNYYDGAFKSIKANMLVANELHHIRIVIDDTANTYNVYINGVLEGNALAFVNNSNSGVNKIVFETNSANSNYNGYIDAIGLSTDANYKIGDNAFWRHYKESDDPFESEDVGTKSLSIDWIDAISAPNFAEIIAEFNEHKKIIDNFSDSAVQQMAEHYLPSASTAGWFAVWLKTDDVTLESRIYIEDDPDLNILFRIFNTQFQVRTGGAWRQATNSPTPANDTYYFIYIQWYADNTFDLWIDNVLYEDGTANNINQVDGISRVGISSTGTADPLTVHTYFDAPTCSLDAASPERGDNRIFDYNDIYTREDITSDIVNVETQNKLGLWRTGTMYSKTSYENSEIFVQVYDINSKLAMEADLKKRDQVERGMKYEYPLRDKNQDDLENPSSNTFDVAKIHDPSDSTSMLKVILPNVGEADGDLILVEADTKATTYSPTTIKYPDYKMLTVIGDLADSVVIVYADGKCYMDDDKASGTVLDYDTAADFDKMTKPVLVTDILENVNYLEVRGAINTATGRRFVKIIDTVGTDKKKSWRYTNNKFKTQADVDAYATAISSRIMPIKIFKIEAQSIGAHNMGETINYKYVKTPYNVPQANYYIIYERIDYDQNENIIILSEGMVEESKYAEKYERTDDFSNSDGGQIYDTDLVVLTIPIYADGGATQTAWRVVCSAVGHIGNICFMIDDNIDIERPMVFKFPFWRSDANNDTVDILKYLRYMVCDGAGALTEVWPGDADTLPATALNKMKYKTYTLSADTLPTNSQIWLYLKINEAGRNIDFFPVMLRYYRKLV